MIFLRVPDFETPNIFLCRLEIGNCRWCWLQHCTQTLFQIWIDMRPDVQIFGTHAVANIIYSGSNPAMKLPQNSSKFVTFFIHKTSSDRLFLPRSGPNASANGMCNRFCLATLPVRWVRILDGRWWGWRLWKEDWRKPKGNNSTGSKLADFRTEVAGQNGM